MAYLSWNVQGMQTVCIPTGSYDHDMLKQSYEKKGSYEFFLSKLNFANL